MISGVSCDKGKACIELNIKMACCTGVPSRESSIHTNTACRKMNRVTETTNMGQSNGTNLKPVPPILFFHNLMKFRKYSYSSQTAGLKDHRVLVRCMEGKC